MLTALSSQTLSLSLSFSLSLTFSLFFSFSPPLSSGGARGVMVIVTGYGHGDTSSIPGQD